MLTPQEVSEHAFTKASFGGYNMAMVDEFLDTLTADYTALYKENAVLKSKMKVLVDKVEEYRSTEDAMRKALLTAQRLADEMVQEAEEKKTAILADAENEARRKIAGLRQELDDEAHRLASAKETTADFVGKLKLVCTRELEFLDQVSQLTAPAAPGPDPVVSAAQEIESSVERLTREEPAPEIVSAPEEDTIDLSDLPPVTPAEEPGGLYEDIAAAAQAKTRAGMEETHFEITLGQPKPAPAPSPAPRAEAAASARRIDFDHLQFGKDYEIK